MEFNHLIKRDGQEIRHLEQPWSFSARAEGDVLGDDLSLGAFWRVLCKRRWIIISSIIAALLLSVAYCIVVKPRYTAAARVAIDPDKDSSMGFQDAIAVSTLGDPQIKLETEVRILQSETLALDVVDRLHLDHETQFIKRNTSKPATPSQMRADLLRAWQSALTVKAVPKTNLIEISFRSKSPDLSANIVNTLINSYTERNFRVKYEATMQASDWLSSQLGDVRVKTQEAEQKLADYQKKSGIISWGKDNSNSVVTDKLSELMKALTATQADRIMKEARYRVALDGEIDALDDIAPGNSLQVMRTQQADLKNQYTQATAKYGDAYPRVRQLKAQIDQVGTAIQAELRNVTERLRDDFESSKHAEEALTSQVDKQTSEAYKLNESAVQLQILQRDAESNRGLYEGLLRRLKEAGIVAGLKSTNVNVVDYASPPARPSDPNLTLVMGLGLGCGCLVGILCSCLLESVDDSVGNVDEAEAMLGMPSLASIPKIAQHASKKARYPAEETSLSRTQQIALLEPRSGAAEAFRALRTSILLSCSRKAPKTIVFTSSFPGEGKSTSSVNTAIVFAEQNARVLLIDADLRRSSLHRTAGTKAEPGLSAVLTGAATFEESARPLKQIPNLVVLPAGLMPPDPAHLLGSDAMRELLDQCATKFDFIIIDTPPALAVTDAVVAAARADCTILVVRSGSTSKQAVRRLRNLLLRANANIAGVVINGVNANASYGYHKYSDYQYYSN